MNIDKKTLPFKASFWQELADTYGTPLYVYDQAGIQRNLIELKAAFSWAKNYRNYFAVKALPTPAVLNLLADGGMGFDCASLAELSLIESGGLASAGIFYTSNNPANEVYRKAAELGAVINLDKAVYLKPVVQAIGTVPLAMAVRYNPGSSIRGNQIIGQPQQSQFGDTAENCLTTLVAMRDLGVKHLGLHSMLVSNEKNPQIFAAIATSIKELVSRASLEYGLKIDFINLGGGFGIDYQAGEAAVDIRAIGQAVKTAIEGELDLDIYTEAGRYVTGPHGYLLTSVTHEPVESYKTFLPVDLSINNLNRLATVEAAYHYVSLPARPEEETRLMTVVGSMCIAGDQLFKDRQLPASVGPGDLLVVHDVGAHARADASNYNGKLRCAEVLVKPDGQHSLIRRHETISDLLATVEDLA